MKKLILLIILLIIGSTSFFMLSSAKTNNEEKVFYSDKLVGLKEISIDGNCDINIESSDSKDLHCSLNTVKKGFVMGDTELYGRIENDVLHIKAQCKEGPVCVVGTNISKIVVNIPKSYKNKLSVKNGLGTTEILNLNCKNIDCNSKGGKINMCLDNIGGNITANLELGSIDLKLPKNEKFNLDAKAKLGKVTNDLSSNIDPSLKDKTIKVYSKGGNINISGS